MDPASTSNPPTHAASPPTPNAPSNAATNPYAPSTAGTAAFQPTPLQAAAIHNFYPQLTQQQQQIYLQQMMMQQQQHFYQQQQHLQQRYHYPPVPRQAVIPRTPTLTSPIVSPTGSTHLSNPSLSLTSFPNTAAVATAPAVVALHQHVKPIKPIKEPKAPKIPKTKESTAPVRLPLAKIKRIMKDDPEVQCNIQHDALLAMQRATELFVVQLMQWASKRTLREKRKQVAYRDMATAVREQESLQFLQDVVPEMVLLSEAVNKRAQLKKVVLGETEDSDSSSEAEDEQNENADENVELEQELDQGAELGLEQGDEQEEIMELDE